MADGDPNNLTQLTVDLLGAYVANNQVQHGDLAQLIQSTHAALKEIESPEPPTPEEPEHKPAVSLRKSLGSKTHIISMIDGKAYQTLKRHLSKHDLTPDQYRERYGLPKSYPMVAQAYSEARRAIAEKLGLGRKVKGDQDNEPAAETPAKTPPAPVAVPATPKRVGRPAKAAVAPAVTAEPKPAKAAKPARAASAAPEAPPASLAKPRATNVKSATVAAPAETAASPAPAPAATTPKAQRSPTKKAPSASKA